MRVGAGARPAAVLEPRVEDLGDGMHPTAVLHPEP
jgi:hypothetical protein